MDLVSQFSEVSSEACLRGINKGTPPDGFDQTNPLKISSTWDWFKFLIPWGIPGLSRGAQFTHAQ